MIDVAIDHLDKSNNKETETYQEQHSPLTDDEVEYATNVLTKIHDPSFVTSVQNKCDESRQRRKLTKKAKKSSVGGLSILMPLTQHT